MAIMAREEEQLTSAERLARIPIIDTDTHIIEPPDLWTSRVSRKFVDLMPRVETDAVGNPRWRMGDRWLTAVARYACAGLPRFPPYKPSRFEEVVTASFDPQERVRWMDEQGIYAAVLYPNIIAFDTHNFWEMPDRAASVEAVRAYNDYLVDLAGEAPNRLLPITMLPFWDLDATVAEIKRAHGLGHRGILWANKFELIGLPSFTDPYWDPVYATAADLGLSVNTHVGFANKTGNTDVRGPEWVKNYNGRAEVAKTAPGGMLSNGLAMAQLVTSELVDRFPQVKFVSVEAGAGYVPWVLDSLDWFWHAYGCLESTGYKPSEAFARQCLFGFSYETSTLPLFGQYPDNFMFSTDFPHDQAVYPGPCSPATNPRQHVITHYQNVPADLCQKLLHDNAATLYGVDVPEDWAPPSAGGNGHPA